VEPAILSKIKKKQFGATPKSSTTFALITMFNKWTKDTDGNGPQELSFSIFAKLLI
jgi:hypothetical protein